jgi:hypothetical protein
MNTNTDTKPEWLVTEFLIVISVYWLLVVNFCASNADVIFSSAALQQIYTNRCILLLAIKLVPIFLFCVFFTLCMHVYLP